MNPSSYWQDTAVLPRYKKLTEDCTVDVVVIGAGITGVTAAYLFKQAGYTVALLERGRCGGFDTSSTTAHLTHVTDTRLHELATTFGKDGARLVWEGGRAAIDLIEEVARQEEIKCEFVRVPGYLFASEEGDRDKERAALQKDFALANELGFPAEMLESVPLYGRPGIKFWQQAKFHPLKYISRLLRTIPGDGSHVFEHTESTEVEEKPLQVKTGQARIRCSYVVVATHNPLTGKTNLASATLFQTKLFLYTSYAVGAKIPKGKLEEASFWDTGEPYDYLRIDRKKEHDYAILGGEDHKTGQAGSTEKIYTRLKKKMQKLLPAAQIDAEWSGQVIETPDGLPYMGETSARQFVSTGYSGNGMTFGTLGAMMAVDAFRKQPNPWQKLFDVHRKEMVAGAWHYLKENKDYPLYLVRNWLAKAEGSTLRSLHRNEGKILKLDGKKVAAYCDAKGKISTCSAVCTHLGCIVGWNDAEKTWDCPCHGSRFAATGEVLTGPAETPLEKIEAKK